MIKLPTLCQRIFLCAMFASAVSVQAAGVPGTGDNTCYDAGIHIKQECSMGGDSARSVSPSKKVTITGFSFPALTDQPLSTTVTSSTATIAGIGAGTAITITAGGNYSVNATPYTSMAGTIDPGQTLNVQIPTSAAYFTTSTVTVNIGGTTADFVVTTVKATAITGFNFTAQTNVTPGTVITSNTANIGGLGAGIANISISGGTYSINGGAYVSTGGTIIDGQTLTVKLTSSSSNSVFSQAIVTIGGMTAAFNVTTIAAPGVPVILPSLPISIPGASSTPAIGNLGSGSGPNVASGVASVLTGALGKSLRYISQSAQGTAMLSGFNGGNLAFMPLVSQTSDSRVNGVYAVGNGQYQVVFNGLSNLIAPALVHLDQLLGLLPGVVAAQQDNGVIVATYNGATYAVQPGVQVQVGPATGVASLILGNDGMYRFVDAQGNAQVLYPAFADVATLRSTVAPNMLAAGSATIQLDGSARLIGSGQAYTLRPDYTLGGIPAANIGQSVWQEAAQRYRMSVVSVPLAAGTSQGFNVGP